MLIYLTLRQLEMFRTVARLKSFSQAAEALNISQSALSQAIIQMEAMLGAQLFARTKRSVAVLPAAEKFLARIDRLLTDYSTAVIELRADNNPAEGRVAVACLASVATKIVLNAVQEFRRKYPRALVQVFDDHPDGIVERVKNGVVDMAVSCLFERDSGVKSIPLLEDRFCAVCRPNHRLSKRASINWTHLQDFDFVAMARGTGIRALIDKHLPSGMVKFNATYEVARVPSVIEIVENTDSVSAVPALALESNASNSQLYHRPLRDPEIWREISLILPRGSELSATAAAFQKQLMSSVLHERWKNRRDIRVLVPESFQD